MLAGCIFAEMAAGTALFTGDSDIDQLRKIFWSVLYFQRTFKLCTKANVQNPINHFMSKFCFIEFLFYSSVLGTPNEDHWPGVTNLRHFSSFFPNIKETCLHKKCLIRGSGFDLLKMMLVYNPAKRISAKKILMHPYFNGFDPDKRFPPLTDSSTLS